MIIRCRTLYLEKAALSPVRERVNGRWAVKVGIAYQVLALEQIDDAWFASFEHHEQEMPVAAPLALFDVIDSGLSSAWRFVAEGDKIALRPPEFDDPYFKDDVQERVGDALERYRALKVRMLIG